MHIVMAIALVVGVVQMESKLLLFFAFSLQAAVITTSSSEEELEKMKNISSTDLPRMYYN